MINIREIERLEKESDRRHGQVAAENNERHAREQATFQELRRIIGAQASNGSDTNGHQKLVATIKREDIPEAPESPVPRTGTKTAKIHGLLKRPGGVTVAGIMTATGWKITTVRGHLSALRKHGYRIESDKNGPAAKRTYWISA